MKRDQTIDTLRGFAMTWVILIHCIFWTYFFYSSTEATLKSFLLIEMPLFFFVSGASFMIAKKKNYLEFIKKRLKRLLIPYWCYVVVGLLIAFLTYATFSIKQFGFVIPRTVPTLGVPYLGSALWFIWPFLLITITMPLFRYYFEKKEQIWWKLLPLIVMMLIILIMDLWIPNQMEFKCWLLYNFFTYLGFFYPILKEQNKKQKQIIGTIGIISLLTTLILGITNLYPFDMQINKFQYNLIFLLYNLSFLSFLYVILNWFLKGIDKLKQIHAFKFIFTSYEKNSYTIFLFHPIVFLLIERILHHFSLVTIIQNHQYLIFPFYFIIIWILSSLIGRIFNFIETPFWKKWYQKYKEEV